MTMVYKCNPVFVGWVLFRAIVNDCLVIADRKHILQEKTVWKLQSYFTNGILY